MSIPIKNLEEIEIMAEGGGKLAVIRDKLASIVWSGLDAKQLELAARRLIKQAGGEPNFCLTKNYPYSICVSINDEIVHGIPNDKKIKQGDIVGIDVGMLYKGWHLDTATTIGAGKISENDQKLLRIAKTALDKAIAMIKRGIKLGVVQNTIQTYVESSGFSLIRNFAGHGIGRELHEQPRISNIGKADEGPVLEEGMVLAIEPMVSAGGYEVKIAKDGWTAILADGSHGAHFEHTVAVTKNGARVLTR